MLIFLLIGSVKTKAQVIIEESGTNSSPHPAAVLDLRSENKGLLLPNVSLSNVNALTVMTNPTEDEKYQAKGMLVYNTNVNLTGGNGTGIYVWNGTRWNLAFSKDEMDVDLDDYISVNPADGDYSLSGNYCYDVFKSDGGTSCGNLSERSNSFASGHEFTYSLLTSQVINNLKFIVVDSNSIKITKGITTQQISKTGKLTFKHDIKNLFVSGEKKTVSIFALFEDQYNQKKKVSMNILVQDCWCCGAKTLMEDGVTSGWLNFMCYNLGAEDPDRDPFSYAEGTNNGDLYQWGRPKDGHQLRNSTTTAVLSSTNVPGHNLFINNTADWRDGGGQNSRWGDGTQNLNVSKPDNDPCPAGWKVPSLKQWQLLLKEGSGLINNVDNLANGLGIANKWVWTGNGYKVGDSLYLPAAGARSTDGGTPEHVGRTGFYWSSTVSGTSAFFMYFHQEVVSPGSDFCNRANGLSVRCVAE